MPELTLQPRPARWVFPEHEQPLRFSDDPLVDRILWTRGIRTPADAQAFLNPIDVALHDPMTMPDMAKAVGLIKTSIAHRRRIVIFGDYDVDGVTSTAMLTRVITKLGGVVEPLLPHRMREGYGLTPAATQRVLEANPELVITADCGSSSYAEIQQLLDSGADVVVLDHHQVTKGLQPEVAFVSPRRADNEYPYAELAAGGVAYTLIRALLGDDDAEMYLPYVALATVADVVSLTGENRTMTARGINMLQRWSLPGFKALCASAGIDQRNVGAWEIGHVIGPRLNAAGRIAEPMDALNLLLANDAMTAAPLAITVSELNRQRRELTTQAQAEAEQYLALHDLANAPALVVADPGWTSGIVGLVASRLAETHNRPTVVLEQGDEFSRGSARSVGDLNIIEAISAQRDLLVRFGGHRGAAGLTLETRQIDAFTTGLQETVWQMLDGLEPQREIRIDAVLPPDELRLETVSRLKALEPFGQDNPEPQLLLQGVKPRYAKRSRDGRHLFFQIPGNRMPSARAVMFGAGARIDELAAPQGMDVVVTLRSEFWDGRHRLAAHVVDFRPAEQ